MTSTPATTSASPSTSNDSPIQDNNGASEPMSIDQQTQSQRHLSPEQQRQHQRQQQKSQVQQQQSSKQPQANTTEQKRPMNAFLLFCKKQRSLVRAEHPNCENREITKILGDWWSKLDKEQKSKYTDLARQHKEAFMEANPDFKWCKTQMNSNNNNNSNSNTNSDDCHARNNKATQESSLLPTSIDLPQSNSRDTLTNNRQQLEAPKPPKKRFLERNDSNYTKNNSINHETNSHAKDGPVPYISCPFDDDTLVRVIGETLTEKSANSPSGLNMCKNTNRNSSNNLTSSVCVNSTLFTTSISTAATPTTAASTTTSMSLYSTGADEPVDFSMNRTINTTSQSIIDNVIEKIFSGPADLASGNSNLDGTDNVHSQLGSSVRRDNLENT